MSVDKRFLKQNLLGNNETSLGFRTDRPYANDGGSEESWLGSVTAFLSSVWDDLTGDDKKAVKKTVQKYLDKQNAEGAEKNKGILSKWQREGEWQDNDYYSGLLDSERPIVTEDDSEHELDFISDESYNKQWDADNQDPIRQNEREMSAGWDAENQDPIRQNERELSALSAPAEDAPSSKMSPAGKQALVGLLKDFLTPAEDAPPTQVRSAGISRGSTPFPSLLSQSKQPRKYYENKGLV